MRLVAVPEVAARGVHANRGVQLGEAAAFTGRLRLKRMHELQCLSSLRRGSCSDDNAFDCALCGALQHLRQVSGVLPTPVVLTAEHVVQQVGADVAQFEGREGRVGE